MYWGDNENAAHHIELLLLGHVARRAQALPDEFTRTMHVVLHAVHSQAGGVSLTPEHIRDLARIKAQLKIYLYKMEAEGENVAEFSHECPHARLIVEPKRPSVLDGVYERAYLSLSSVDSSPEEISSHLGLEPTWFRRRGELPQTIPRPKYPPVNHLWQMDAGLDRQQDMAAHFDALHQVLVEKHELLSDFGMDYRNSIGIGSAACFDTSTCITLSQSLIERMARLGMWFDLDLYLC